MDKVEVIIITGMSGAGKTTVMAVFENMGFYCIDNYPAKLLKEFGDLLIADTSHPRIALAVRIEDARKAIEILENMDWIDLKIVFLTSDDDTLLTRYKFTRRSHPLLISNKASTLSEAIEIERKTGEAIEQLADMRIDTGNLKPARLQDLIEEFFSLGAIDPFRISFISFGYKHGVPRDADLLFDVRFLPNPYWEEPLRELTGNDKEVYNYVINKPETQEFINKMTDLFDYFFENYQKEGKMHLVIGIGCTGGQHRSVSLVNYFYDYYKEVFLVHKLHRDANH